MSTVPHEQGWQLAGRALGVEALDQFAETGMLDDSAAAIILDRPDDVRSA